jgi:hypothetical protein
MLQRWDEVEVDLRVEVTLTLDEGLPPQPLLAAFAGEQPVAVARLRRFGQGDALQALIEVLALVLPLGTDRVALALPARAHVADAGADGPADPAADGAAQVDGQLLVLLATAEVRAGRARLRGHLHPLARHDGRWHWLEETTPIDPDTLPLTDALGLLLERRASLQRRDLAAGELQQQLARCLLLGHLVVLSDEIADRLEPDRLIDVLADPRWE